MTKMNLKYVYWPFICLWVFFFFNRIAHSWFYLHFTSGDFILFLLISNNCSYTKDINTLLSRLGIFFLNSLQAFWVCLLAPNRNLVSSFSAERNLTSLCLPEKSSVLLRLAASLHHEPSSCFRTRFRRDFPNALLGSAFRRGLAHPMEMVSSHFWRGSFQHPAKEADFPPPIPSFEMYLHFIAHSSWLLLTLDIDIILEILQQQELSSCLIWENQFAPGFKSF